MRKYMFSKNKIHTIKYQMKTITNPGINRLDQEESNIIIVKNRQVKHSKNLKPNMNNKMELMVTKNIKFQNKY